MRTARAISYDTTPVFAKGDRVSHAEHGDGFVTGTYGRDKLAVDFDNVGTKRVAPDTMCRGIPLSQDQLAALNRMKDEREAKAQAYFERWQEEERLTLEEGSRLLALLDQGDDSWYMGAEIIPFPSSRIVRYVQHGDAVIRAHTLSNSSL